MTIFVTMKPFISSLILIVTILCTNVYGFTKEDVYFKNLDIYSYRSFASLQTFHIIVPVDTRYLEWSLALNKSKSSCEESEIQLFTQYGSFPIDSFDGEHTFPPTYRTNRTELVKVNMTKTSIIILDRPVYGQWFLGGFMESNNNQVVKKLSSLGCEYALVANVTYLKEDVEVLVPGRKFKLSLRNGSSYYRFLSDRKIYKYIIRLEDCSARCNITVSARSAALPHDAQDSFPRNFFCNSSAVSCGQDFSVFSPEVDRWQFISLFTSEENVTVDITITLFECTTGSLKNLTTAPTCYMNSDLITTSMPDFVFTSTFGLNFGEPETLVIPRSFVSMTTFLIDSIKDIGGTLTINLAIIPIEMAYFQSNQTQDIAVCIQRGYPTISADHQLTCRDPKDIVRLNSTHTQSTINFPYPEPGRYFIGYQDMSKQNISHSGSGIPYKVFDTDNSPSLGLMVKISLDGCEEKKCSNGGSCRSVMKGAFTMSFCYCVAGAQGFTCADESRMVSSALQLLYTLMLCLSNLAFIPAIIISFKRWRYIECLIYTFNMVASTFYHACDMSHWSMYGLCFISYRVYQFSDFYLSLLSFWVTLLAMSRIRSGHILTVDICGIVVIAILITANTIGLISNLLPIATGCAIVVVAWGMKCYKLKVLYPDKRDYLWALPGLAMAGLGLIVFAFVESDSNYPYTHSFWHLCIAFCIPFLLPRKKVVWKLDEITEVELTRLEDQHSVTYGGEDEDEAVLVLSNTLHLQRYSTTTTTTNAPAGQQEPGAVPRVSYIDNQFRYTSLA